MSATTLVATAARADVRVERADDAKACPDPATFASRASEGISDERRRSVGITVRFERTTSGFASAVRTSDGSERALDDPSSSCDGLAEATLLAVRLAFDRDDGPPAPAERPADAPPRRSAVHPDLFAGVLGAVGLGGSVGGRVVGAAVLGAHEEWSVGATAFLLLPQTERFGSGTVETSVVGGGLDACRQAPFGSLGGTIVGLCGRMEIARLAGTSRGFAKNDDASRPLVSGSLLVRAHRRIGGPVGAFGELGAVVPINRERFEIQGIGRVYDPPLVAGTGTIGLQVDFE